MIAVGLGGCSEARGEFPTVMADDPTVCKADGTPVPKVTAEVTARLLHLASEDALPRGRVVRASLRAFGTRGKHTPLRGRARSLLPLRGKGGAVSSVR